MQDNKCDFCGENLKPTDLDKISIVVYCEKHEHLKKEANKEYFKIVEEDGGRQNATEEKITIFMGKYIPYLLSRL